MVPPDDAVLAVARDAMRGAEREVPAYSHVRSPRTFTQHQLFALLAVRRFLGIDFRAVAPLVAGSAELRAVLGLEQAPHYSTLCYASQRLLDAGPHEGLLRDVLERAERRRAPGRRRTWRASLAPLAVLAGMAAAAEGSPGTGADVLRATVRFHGGRTADDAAATGSVRLRAILEDPGALAGFDPSAGGVSISLGPAGLLEVPAGGGAEARLRGDGSWRLEARGPDRLRARLSFDPGTGRLDLHSRGADLSGLLEAGPTGLGLEVRLGAAGRTAVLDLREASSRRWDHRSGAAGGDGEVAVPGDPVAFERIDSGPFSGIARPLEAVVTEGDSWEALWREHAPGSAAPEVDFESESVVAVFLGQRPTTGYAAEIVSIASGPAGLEVSWREVAPGPDCLNLQVLTNPFVLVRVPVQGATAVFQGTLLVVDCGP